MSLGRHAAGGAERQSLEVLSPQQPECLMPHYPPEPAGKRGGLGETGQPEPGSHEGLLHHVLRLVEVAQQGQRIAEGHVLITLGHLCEGVEVTLPGPANQLLELHAILSAIKCQTSPATFEQLALPAGTGPSCEPD